MSPVKVFFFLALAFAAVMAEETEHKVEKRNPYYLNAAIPYTGVYPGYYPGVVPRAYPYAHGAAVYKYGYDDGSYFPGKYPGTELGYTGYYPHY